MTQPRNEREAHYVLHSTFPRHIFIAESRRRRRQASWLFWTPVALAVGSAIAWLMFSAA